MINRWVYTIILLSRDFDLDVSYAMDEETAVKYFQLKLSRPGVSLGRLERNKFIRVDDENVTHINEVWAGPAKRWANRSEVTING